MKTAAPDYTRRRPPNGHSRSLKQHNTTWPKGEASWQEGGI